MRRSKEIMFLFALLVVGAALVLWYVLDRRARNRAAPAVTTTPATPSPGAGATNPAGPPGPPPPATAPAVAAAPVDLRQNEGKTIDFTSGKPVVKDSPEDKAVIDAAVKDMADATKDVVFEAPKPKPAAPPKS